MARGDKSARNIAKKKKNKNKKKKEEEEKEEERKKKKKKNDALVIIHIHWFCPRRASWNGAFNTVVVSTNTFTWVKRREIECVQE